ncbi:RNA polymerase II transcriptional coactivator KELP isoform X2 [Phoenix dactylifera]|uniref:RNA polymerase II transcriptional coactivator KELP isoform X2 n=1 Tax=Phoenix dactylifera TaxID=42345 RepID=A0A8B8JB55_PHODC|nr:RNA polymerase II transcriptional coactivator KELP isoform X2 [Phoenix dactylifera]
MDAETQRRIEEVVLEILESSDMTTMTEYQVRRTAAERLGLDLSIPDRKRFVRSVVESFLLSNKDEPPQQQQEQEPQEEEEEEQEEEEEEAKKGSRREKEYDDEGDLILCRLSNKRRVTLQEFRGKTLVSIREYYQKDGKELPTAKGIKCPSGHRCWTLYLSKNWG